MTCEDDLHILPPICKEIAAASPLEVTPQAVSRFWWQEFGQLCLESHGDSFGSDVRGAQALGIPVLWLNRKQHEVPVDNPPTAVASDLTGLLKFL